MKKLLENDFSYHYGLGVSGFVAVVSTTDVGFSLKDDTVLIYPLVDGIARYENPKRKEVNVINYESFFKSLPQPFQDNKDNCDLIVFTSDNQHFLLNELTVTKKKKGKKRTKAAKQMLQVLKLITAVPAISSFINQYTVKQCCYFNQKPQAPQPIKCVNAFNRMSELSNSEMLHLEIKKLGFDFAEFSGGRPYLL